MKGRKPLPTSIRKARGNPGGRPINRKEPIPPRSLKRPPSWLNVNAQATADAKAAAKEQRKLWYRLLREAPPGLLTTIDAELFAAYVVAAHLHAVATVKVQELGAVIAAPRTGTPMHNPYLSVLNRATENLRKLGAELGFSPTSRSRIKVDTPPPEDPVGEIQRRMIEARDAKPTRAN